MAIKHLKGFYATPTEASERKQQIVVKYHAAWAQVLRSKPEIPSSRQRDLAYVDLFAGQGIYDDGRLSTPLLILEGAARDAYMRDHLIAIFNEGDPDTAGKLDRNIAKSGAVAHLRHKPEVRCARVEQDILREIGGVPRCPTLLFADPWGYKGLSFDLLASFLHGFGNDLIFFFNYNRISAAISNSVLEEPIDAVFGKERAGRLRSALAGAKGSVREELIMDELASAFKEEGARTPVKYRFVCKGRLSHHLMFVSKHPLGCDIMKAVMSGESSRRENGVASFEFNEIDTGGQGTLFPNLPLEQLANELTERFAGHIFGSFAELYDRSDHARFGQAEHRKALQLLEKRGLLSVASYAAKRTCRDGELSIPSNAILMFK